MGKTRLIRTSQPDVGIEEIREIEKVFASKWLGLGDVVKELEDRLKEFLSAKNVIAVNSGTSALHLALSALGIKKNDEVVVPSFTFAATIQAIEMTGATPLFADIEKNTLNIDVNDVLKKINKKTKVIMPVHFGGLPCDMDNLIKLTKMYPRITILEDAAHAFGSRYKRQPIGSLESITCFSFDPIKNITCGEGGAISLQDDRIAAILKTQRILGISKDTWSRYQNKRSWVYYVTDKGFRYHMNNINAAIGLAQLKKFGSMDSRKKEIVLAYDKAFANIPQIVIPHRNYEDTSFFNYVIQVTGKREGFIKYLEDKGIEAGVHYPPNHCQPYFRKYYRQLPVTELVSKRVVTLPLHSGLTKNQVDKIISCARQYFKKENKCQE